MNAERSEAQESLSEMKRFFALHSIIWTIKSVSASLIGATTVKHRPMTFQVGGESNLVGEGAFRRLIRLIIQDAHRRNPQPLPVIVFLDGDYTGQPHGTLDQVVDDFLETSGMVFGIK